MFSKLKQVNLKVNLAKCEFAKSQVKVLGHIVSGRGIQPDEDKVTVIQNLPPPTDKTGVKSFLGVVNFYQRFIRDCSTLAEPLIFLT